MRYKRIVLVIFSFAALLWSQNNIERQIVQKRSQLDDLKREITRIEQELGKVRRETRSAEKELKVLDKQLAYVARYKGQLKSLARLLEKRIRQINGRLKETNRELQQLKTLYAQRVVYAYKHGKVHALELLLSAKSFNQALIRWRYLQLVAQQDARMIRSIERKKADIERLKRKLAAQLAEKKRAIEEKEQQERLYAQQRKAKDRLLRKLRGKQGTYREKIARIRQQQQDLLNLIIQLEEEKKRLLARRKSGKVNKQEVDYHFANFRKAKGKLIWPVRGKLISTPSLVGSKKYHTRKTPKVLEIKSKLGTPVKVVFSGVVRKVTYMAGNGNTIIVDHGNGYYTTYSHLDEIYVNMGQQIKTGQVIGTVGDSGSLHGSMLKFAIIGKQNLEYASKWLRKN